MNTKRLKNELDTFNAENKKLRITMGTLGLILTITYSDLLTLPTLIF